MALICANFSSIVVESNSKETILVTGATGLVGTQILKMLDCDKHRVIGLARSLPKQLQPGIEWVCCDLLDIVALEAALVGVNKVYHAAGLVSFDPKFKTSLKSINVDGTANLVNACIKNNVQKLLHVSSVAAIGEAKGKKAVIHENLEWDERGATQYANSKYFSEMEVWRGVCEGLDAVIINPSIILGAGDWEKGSTAMFKSAFDEFPWYTEGVHGFVDVLDVARIAIKLMESDISSERFIINGANITYKALFDRMAEGFGKKKPSKKVTPLLAEIVWRFKYLKGIVTGKPSILNKNTARTALAVCEYSSEKLIGRFPDFNYTPIRETVNRVCQELGVRYRLKANFNNSNEN